MALEIDNAYYFPWVRKGLSNKLTEKDRLGDMSGDTSKLLKKRPAITINTIYNTKPVPIGEGTSTGNMRVAENKDIQFISPGDIAGMSTDAIIKVAPKPASEGLAIEYHPYIEFWEPDFLWRYTPAIPNEERLTPWLALLVCEQSLCKLKPMQGGQSYVSFEINDEQYKQIFLSPQDLWKCGHAQGFTRGEPELSRLLALRSEKALKPLTEYCAFLVPSFETGRVRGLDIPEQTLTDILEETIAQAPAWEEDLATQKKKERPLHFPVYYSWTFKTGIESFDTLARNLKVAGGFTSEINIDVTRMGEGLDYNTLAPIEQPEKKTMGMPAAAVTLDYNLNIQPFPSPADAKEKKLFGRLKDLISKNPVFQENIAEIEALNSGYLLSKTEEVGDDDPWVTPPVYGGKHIMATSLEDKDNKETPWLQQVNLDIHHRAVAGMGKKTVQLHQEELVNRAWKQVETINALNNQMRKMLLSANVNHILTQNTMEVLDENTVASMMQHLGSMKDATVKINGVEVSLANILQESGISQSFATAYFQNLTEDLANKVSNLDTASVMQEIANKQIFELPEHTFMPHTANLSLLKKLVPNLTDALKRRDYEIYCDKINTIYHILDQKDYNKLGGFFLNYIQLPTFDVFLTDSEKRNFAEIIPMRRLLIRYFKGKENPNDSIQSVPLCRYITYHTWLDENFGMGNNPIKQYFIFRGTSQVHKFKYPYDVFCTQYLYENIIRYEGSPSFTQLSADDTCFGILFEVYDWIEKFFNERSHFNNWFSFYGSTETNFCQKANTNGQFTQDEIKDDVDVIGIEDNKYNALFNNNTKPITKIGSVYFVKESILKDNKYGITCYKMIPKFGNSYFNKITPYDFSHKYNSYIEAYEAILSESKSSNQKFIHKVVYYTVSGWCLKDTSNNFSTRYSEITSGKEQGYDFRTLFHPAMRFLLDKYDEEKVNEIPTDVESTFAKMRNALSDAIISNKIIAPLKRAKYDYVTAKDLQKRAIEYVTHPDYIILDPVAAENSILEINTIADALKLYFPTYVRDANTKLLQSERTDFSRSEILGKLESIKSTLPAPPAPPPVPPSAADALKKCMAQLEMEKRMQEVAETYYKEFFSNPDLIKKYLEELLRSKYPIMAYPIFPEPVYYYLKMFATKFILPCVDDLPADSVAAFKNNPAFEEAYLCGMNTEMGKELLWREYPTDQRGSYFRKFWDSEVAVEDIRDDNFFDVTPQHTWKGYLGDNHAESKTGLTLFTIKGKLMKQYPTTQVFLHRATLDTAKNKIVFDNSASQGNGIFFPVMFANLREDILLVGFKTGLTDLDLIGNLKDKKYGYFLTFKEDVQDLNFQNEFANGIITGNNSAHIGNEMINTPTLFGKHLSLFVNN